MVTIGFKIPQGALEACKKQIEAKLATIVADVTSKTYNYIIAHQYPYWSGAYIASWSASIGKPNYKNLEMPDSDSLSGPTVRYAKPKVVPIFKYDGVSAYAKGYIVNDARHAMKVEYEGTPTHADEGWYVAVSARNFIVGSYKFF